MVFLNAPSMWNNIQSYCFANFINLFSLNLKFLKCELCLRKPFCDVIRRENFKWNREVAALNKHALDCGSYLNRENSFLMRGVFQLLKEIEYRDEGVNVLLTEVALHRCSNKKLLWKYAAILYEKTQEQVQFQKSCKSTLLKSHLCMGVLLQGCYIFSEHLFLRTPLEACFYTERADVFLGGKIRK